MADIPIELKMPTSDRRKRLHTISGNDGSDVGGTVTTMTDTTWAESAVTWNNQPSIDGTTLGSLGAVTASPWYELDVTDAVTGNGTYVPQGDLRDQPLEAGPVDIAGPGPPQVVVDDHHPGGGPSQGYGSVDQSVL